MRRFGLLSHHFVSDRDLNVCCRSGHGDRSWLRLFFLSVSHTDLLSKNRFKKRWLSRCIFNNDGVKCWVHWQASEFLVSSSRKKSTFHWGMLLMWRCSSGERSSCWSSSEFRGKATLQIAYFFFFLLLSVHTAVTLTKDILLHAGTYYFIIKKNVASYLNVL